MEAKEILNRFKNGEITLEEAEHYFRKEPLKKWETTRSWTLTEKSGPDFPGSDFFQWKSR